MYYQIHCKDLDCSEAKESLIREKMEVVEQLLHDYPPDSVMGRVTLWRLPVTDEYYNVRFVLELPGDRCYARANGVTLESALINVAAELERQVKHILTTKRNETHWKRISHRSESIRRTVPVEEEEVLDIQEEIRQRTEKQQGPTEKAA
ncbi:MAG: HPF/RaiA family ribosome-associated protein [Chloroflexota bacterium]|jgi:ribosome-associated translation inhibitor RaiA